MAHVAHEAGAIFEAVKRGLVDEAVDSSALIKAEGGVNQPSVMSVEMTRTKMLLDSIVFTLKIMYICSCLGKEDFDIWCTFTLHEMLLLKQIWVFVFLNPKTIF